MGSGLMGVTISEGYELSQTQGKGIQGASTAGKEPESRVLSRTGILSSKSWALTRVGSGQQIEAAAAIGNGDYRNSTRVVAGAKKEQAHESESVKGLTDNAIHQRVEFEVEFEDGDSECRDSR
jgi:hypothetical protein